MKKRLAQFLAAGLAACFLLLSGLVYPQTVAHAAQHAHHKAATHATVLCSWVCSAGQVLEGPAFGLQPDFGPLALARLLAAAEPSNTLLPVSTTRGPPHFSP